VLSRHLQLSLDLTYTAVLPQSFSTFSTFFSQPVPVFKLNPSAQTRQSEAAALRQFVHGNAHAWQSLVVVEKYYPVLQFGLHLPEVTTKPVTHAVQEKVVSEGCVGSVNPQAVQIVGHFRHLMNPSKTAGNSDEPQESVGISDPTVKTFSHLSLEFF